MADIDVELVTALKLAKSKKMFFAFIPKGTDGKLIVSKKKIPPKTIAEAKKEVGGGKAILGKCFGPVGDMLFEVAKNASPAIAAAIKKVGKRDSGLMLVPNLQVTKEMEEEEKSLEEGESEQGETPETQTEEKAQDQAKTPEQNEPKFDLKPWVQARDRAIKELKALAAKIAATKHATAAGVIKEIHSIITKLPADPKPSDLDRLQDYVAKDDAITAAEEVPSDFHSLKIRQDLLDAISAIRQGS